MKAAGLLLAVVAAFAAAPAWGQVVEAPVVVSSPASGDTYRPGETIVVQVRPGSNPVTSFLSADRPRITLVVGTSNKSLNGTLKNIPSFVSQAFYDYDTRSNIRVTRGGISGVNVLEFSYTVGSADRDTDGVSIAANSLAGGSIGAQTRGFEGGFSYNPNLNKSHAAMSAQSGHKVGPEPPSFSGVSSPSLLLYTCGPFDSCGSASHRLPTIANAGRAYNVTYSVTPALPAGLSVNSSTAVLSGSHNGRSSRRNYTLRATDGYRQTADLTFSLEVRDGAGVESITVTSNPGSDRTYGKNGDFGTNDTITVRVDFNRPIGTIIRSYVCLNIRIGRNTRQACNPTGASRQDKLHFSYAVVESDWDGDGISFPANPLGAGKSGDLRFYRVGIGGGDNRIDRSFGAVPDDPNHKVRGRQTTPSFGSTASPSFSWVKDNAVSQVLPAATGGDGGLTYSIKEGLPDGLVFAAATRTLSGTPTAVQGAANYTLVATDGDGDKVELRFSIEIREIVLSISSPSVAEGAAGETAALPFTVTLNRAPGRQVTVDWAADADPGTAASGADYTAFSGGALTFAAADTSKTVEVTVTGDALDEPDETIRIALSNPSGAVLGSAATGVGTITDDDPTPTLTLSLSDPDAARPDTIRESGAGSATTVTASLSGGTSGEAITVTVSAASTYAALAADGGFSLSTARMLTIAAGQTASAGEVTITATDDAIDSADKTATVSGAVAGGHGLVAARRGPDPDHRRRGLAAELGARPRSGVDLGERRRGDGDRDPEPPLGRRGDDHGVGDGFHGRGGRRLQPEHGERADRRRGTDDEYGRGDGDRGGQPDVFAGQAGDGEGFGVGDARGRGPAGRDPDAARRRRPARGLAGPVVVVGLGERRRGDGDGEPERRDLGRGGHGHGFRGGGVGRGSRRLQPERRHDADHCRERHGEHRDGDDHRRGQRRGFAGQAGDGLRHGGGRRRDRGPGEHDPDPGGRRSPADGDAGARARVDRGSGRGVHGHRDALGRVERRGDDHGVGGGGGERGRRRFRSGCGGGADHRRGGNGEHRDGHGHREPRRHGFPR